MKFPGYMTADEALKNGFTHHGKYYGIPVWIAPDNPDCLVVTKWAPMECIMSVFAFIETTLRLIFGDEACFQFLICGEIKPTKEFKNAR